MKSPFQYLNSRVRIYNAAGLQPSRTRTELKFKLAALLSIICAGCGEAPSPTQATAATVNADVQKQAAEFRIPATRDVEIVKGTSIHFVLVPKGEIAVPGENPHRITIDKPFYMSACEITQNEYANIMDANPSVYMSKNLPVETISWENATGFCRKLSDRVHEEIELPTEDQWEYACRAGRTSVFWNGSDVSALAKTGWFAGNSRKITHDVGSLQANPWGLFDMHGNVWEFCALPKDKIASEKEVPVRGGSWMDAPEFCRSDSRTTVARQFTNINIGFRVVMTIK